ncbi:hypothetical protein [Streptomyces sp. DH8]|uniref:hypothetical protein n=1 Tax=Streptomyces sp. DH8 TaxID=2857008 RepID=UPI001E61AB0C|nr:hypothetical protein [Streptomyces sp. DH8]
MNRARRPSSAPVPPWPPAPPAAGLKGVVLPAVVGSVMVVAAAVLLALLPGKLSEARDFRAARPCEEAGGSAAENGDCLSTRPATVRSTEARPRGKGYARWATLDPGGGAPPHRVRLRGGVDGCGAAAPPPGAGAGEGLTPGGRADPFRAPTPQCRSARPNPAASGIRSPSGGGAARASATGRA